MLVYRSTVAAAALAGALLVGCSAPDQPTDLRTDGPPNVTTVTVLSDLRTSVDPGFNGIPRLIESATHCRLNDEKRPGLVGLPSVETTQVCPDDLGKPSDEEGVAEGAPPSWFVRVVFDKLLDPDVEDLVPETDSDGNPTGSTLGTLANTQPVTLTCNGADVAYGGYYVPNGNSVSWPLGPALYIQPDSAVSVPTQATCEVGIKDMVHNKNGESVPTNQRSFQFKIAPMKLRFAVVGGNEIDDPADTADGSIEHDPHVPVRFYWTAGFTAPDPNQALVFEGADASICETGGTPVTQADVIQVADGATGTSKPLILDVKLNTHPTDATDKRVWKPTTFYRIEFATGAKLTPTQGGPDGLFPDGYKLCFQTKAATM
jgi:hypothetical protein